MFADTVEHNLKYSGRALEDNAPKESDTLTKASLAADNHSSKSGKTSSSDNNIITRKQEEATQQDENRLHPRIKNHADVEIITDAEMEAAAQMCHCHNMIRRLPQGYQTELNKSVVPIYHGPNR